MFNLFRKKKDAAPSAAHEEANTNSADAVRADDHEEMLDDVSFIKDMKYIQGLWQQYDVLLAASNYGWDYMVDTAAYMESADLDDISTITTSAMANSPETELIESYRKSQGSIRDFEPLSVEKGVLAIGGISRVLHVPVKIVWFNQTRILRVFTLIKDELLITKYVETMIRRSFGTENAMKLAKPVSSEKE